MLGAVLSICVNYPGHIEFDGVMQLMEGHTRVYSNWHPAIMSWLLGLSLDLHRDAWPFALLNTFLLFGSFASIPWLVLRPSKFCSVIALPLVLMPQLFLFPSIIWKDVLFAATVLGAFVSLAHSAVNWHHFRARLIFVAIAILLLSIAALSRQNGAVVLPVASIVVALIARSTSSQWIVWGSGFLVVTALLSVSGNALLQMRAGKTLGAVEQIEDLQLYDIAGMLQREPGLPLTIFTQNAPRLEEVLRTTSARAYTPAMQDPVVFTAEVRPFISSSIEVVRRQWAQAVLSHPWLYMTVRSADFSWLIFSDHPDKCLVYTLGVLGPEKQMKSLHLVRRYDNRDEWLEDNYAEPLVKTAAFSHASFGILGFSCVIFFAIRRRPADLVLGAMLVSTALYSGTYYFIGVACQYRYLFALDVSVLASLFYLLTDISPPHGWRNRLICRELSKRQEGRSVNSG